MSEYTKRTVHGRWSSFKERDGGWHSFEIEVEGNKYPVRADSSKPDTIAAMMAVRDKDATFQLAERPGKNINPNTGKPYTDRYVDSVQEGFVGEPTAPARSGGGSRQRSPEETRSIIRQSCLKAAATAYQGRDVDGDITNYVIGAAERYEAWVLREDAAVPVPPTQDPPEEVPEEFQNIPF